MKVTKAFCNLTGQELSHGVSFDSGESHWDFREDFGALLLATMGGPHEVSLFSRAIQLLAEAEIKVTIVGFQINRIRNAKELTVMVPKEEFSHALDICKEKTVPVVGHEDTFLEFVESLLI